MRILALDAAVGAPSAAVAEGGVVVAAEASDQERGAPGLLPGLVTAVLARSPGGFDAVAVTVGPGSFTGLRAAIALAHGLAIGAGVPVLGVTVAEAILALLPAETQPVWVVTDDRRGRVFLSRDGVVDTVALGEMPRPSGPVVLAGDAAGRVAEHLADADVTVSPVRHPDARGAALVGGRRLAGLVPALAAQPLYVAAPAARFATPIRPAPV